MEVNYLQVQMLNPNNMNSTVEDERLWDIDEVSICFSNADEESIDLSNADEESICLSGDDEDSKCPSDADEQSFSTQFVDGEVKTSSFYDDISIEEKDICVSCWLEWSKTGLKPSLKRTQWKIRLTEIDPDDEQDDYSPYHIHT